MPKRSVVARLEDAGFQVSAEEVITAVSAGALSLAEMGVGVVAPFVTPETLEDLQVFDLCGGLSGNPRCQPDAVLLGDLGAGWTVELLNEAFRYVMEGATLVALQRNRYWLGPDGMTLDAGPFVAAIEYATDREAVICGKPAKQFFAAALGSIDFGFERDTGTIRPAMIGDDFWSDVKGAQAAGLQGWLVKTGKFRQGDFEASGVQPDLLLASIAEVVDL